MRDKLKKPILASKVRSVKLFMYTFVLCSKPSSKKLKDKQVFLIPTLTPFENTSKLKC
jgi:hypothetical protein